MSRRILLIGHSRRPEAFDVAERLVSALTEQGITVVGFADELTAFGIRERDHVVTLAEGTLPEGGELAVVLGGDGTILRAAEICRDTGMPLLGINLGHVGFLAEAEMEDVDRIAGFTKRPQDVIGTHFFSPANVMKLLEVVRGKATAKDVLATVMALAKKIKKTAVVSGVCDGFIGNRMIEQYSRQAGFLLEEGCTPQQVDKAVEKWGMAMGPFLPKST